MGRRSFPRRSGARSLPRLRGFFWFNLVLWGAIGGWYLFQPAARQAEVDRLLRNAFDARKPVTALDVAGDLWQLYFSPDYVAGVATGDRTHVYGGAPRLAEASPAAPLRVLRNAGYVVGYSDGYGNPLWAAYRVADGPIRTAAPRPDEFTVDPRTAARIESSVYSGSGYDRGHLAPNHAIAVHHGPAAQTETFRMSNVIPQRHGLNAGLWKQLEERIAAAYPAGFGEVWVLAGPVFGPQPARLRRRVAVPEACYMILVDESDGRVRTTAYLFPQEPPAGAALERFLTSIDEIERRTGLDFLAELPDPAETELEAKAASRPW